MHQTTHEGGVVILGAGAAGATAATELRALGYEGRLTIVNGEPETPYNRTAVNKGLLQGRDTLASVAAPLPDDDRTTVWHGTRALRVDPEARAVHLDAGVSVPYDAVVVATGAEPRPLPVPAPTGAGDRIRVLRTASDAFALRAALDAAAAHRAQRPVRVGVVGAGLLGAETADTLHSEGAAVTMVDPNRTPLRRLFGATISNWVLEEQRRRFRTAFGTTLLGVHPLANALLMRLSDGTSHAVDVIVVAAGVTPSVAALTTSALAPDRGVLVDDRLRVTESVGVYAAGDVARVRRGVTTARGEHWSAALAQGRHVARVVAHDLGLATDPGPFVRPESFATRLHGKAVNVLGAPRTDSREVVLTGSAAEGAVTLGFADEEGRLHAAASLGSPRALNKIRATVEARGALADAQAVVGEPATTAR